MSNSTHIHVRIDDETKKQAQLIFDEIGMDLSTGVNVFIRQVIRNRGLPFLPSVDPFYSESNIAHLMRVKADVEAGRNMSFHELIED